MKKVLRTYIAGLFLMLLAGCHHDVDSYNTPETAESEFYEEGDDLAMMEDDDFDPLIDEFNRIMFEFNLFLDDYIFKPASTTVQAILPEPAIMAMSNFKWNLYNPVNCVNHILQGRFHDAAEDFTAFFMNTTAGVGGLLPISQTVGIYPKYTDFGITISRYGVPNGPMLMLPFLGPMYGADIMGAPLDFILNPISLTFKKLEKPYVPSALTGVQLLSDRIDNGNQLDYARESSYDFYDSFMIMYEQRRQGMVDN